MPRRKDKKAPPEFRWIQRGVHRQKIFHDKPDFLKYLELIVTEFNAESIFIVIA